MHMHKAHFIALYWHYNRVFEEGNTTNLILFRYQLDYDHTGIARPLMDSGQQ